MRETSIRPRPQRLALIGSSASTQIVVECWDETGAVLPVGGSSSVTLTIGNTARTLRAHYEQASLALPARAYGCAIRPIAGIVRYTLVSSDTGGAVGIPAGEAPTASSPRYIEVGDVLEVSP